MLDQWPNSNRIKGFTSFLTLKSAHYEQTRHSPRWDLNFAGTSSNDPIEYLKSINRDMEAKILEKAAKPHININSFFNGL